MIPFLMVPRDRDAYNAYMREYMLKRYHRRMEEARESLGGKCDVCGKHDELHLHHVDPSEKLATTTKLWSYSDERFWAEVEKCILLCEDCHINHHRATHPHGDRRRYYQGCHCDKCKRAAADWSNQWRWATGRRKRRAGV